jgi:glutaredoxin 3
MPSITIYTKSTCGYCHAAKDLLRQKNANFEEISVDSDPTRQAEMSRRANGRRTVPQIFVGDLHIGGCDDLYALERQGKLDPILGGAGS